jgi:Ca2+-binding EF-hand superfamily protein
MRIFLVASAVVILAAMPAAAQMLGRDPSAMLDKADADHDGRISRAEFVAARAADLARLDRNGDGVISRADFGRILKFRPKAATRIDAMIAALDGDHDGKVTQAEIAAAPTLLFDRADADHDGFVDKTERTQLRTLMQQMKSAG